MSLLTQASPFSSVEGKKEKMKGSMTETFKRIENEQINNNKSLSHLQTSKIEQMSLNTLPSNDGERLADFVVPRFNISPVEPILTSGNGQHNAKSTTQNIKTPVSYNKTNGSSFSQSYNTTTPYYQGIANTKPSPPGGQNNQLMEKLNYMIHLLEEQQKEPTQNILEEFALYGLLGIFMIYIVDSFAKVGKYTR